MAIKQILISFILSVLISATACASKVENHDSALQERDVYVSQISNETAPVENDKFSIPDSINFDGILNFDCLSDGWYISNCQIILNNDSSLLKVEGWHYKRGTEFLQFRLKKPVADCFKRLLYEIYSEHDSALKDGFSSVNCGASIQKVLSIKIKLGNKQFSEVINVFCTTTEYDVYPFRPQFEEMYNLMNEILYKIDKEYYKPNRILEAPDWIVEEFNYDYYEPYSDEE